MSNSFYNHGSAPATGSTGASATMRAEFDAIAAGFDKFPTLSGYANKVLVVNAGGTAVTLTAGSLALAGGLTTVGAYASTFTMTGATTVTFPTTGTLATLAGTESLTNKTINLSSNTLTGTIAQFNTALSDGNFATLAGSESLSNKTVVAPVLSGSVTGTYTLAGTPTFSGTIAGAPTTSGSWTHSAPLTVEGSSASDMLRITQTGSGNALVVEDSTNPDSTPVIIDAAGLVVIGHTLSSPMSSGINPRLQIHATTLSSGAYAAIVNWAANNTPATFTLGKVRSGTIGTHGTVASGDVVGRLQWEVSDGADILDVAKIDVTMDGTTGVADLPTRMGFFTTEDGASSPTERLRIDSTGLVTVYSGKIRFPATANPSSDANTLDDYEEGTWTPDVGGTATYTAQTGVYTKIGRLVTVHCTLNINAIGTGSATTISGLPFAVSGSITVNGSVYWSSGAVSPVYVVAQAASSGTTVTLQGITAAGASLSPLSLMGSGTIIRFTLTYPVPV